MSFLFHAASTATGTMPTISTIPEGMVNAAP